MAYGAGKGRAEERRRARSRCCRAPRTCTPDTSSAADSTASRMGSGDPVAGPRDSTWGSQDEVAFNTISAASPTTRIELDTTSSASTRCCFGNTFARCRPRPVVGADLYRADVRVLQHHRELAAGGIKLGSGTNAASPGSCSNTITASNPGSCSHRRLAGRHGGSICTFATTSSSRARTAWGTRSRDRRASPAGLRTTSTTTCIDSPRHSRIS